MKRTHQPPRRRSFRPLLSTPLCPSIGITGRFTLTWVEVFGFGQLDGGARLFLQLYDGLAALANYRAGCIAGDQHLQEVLALLWGRDTQSGKGSHLVKQLIVFTPPSTPNTLNKQKFTVGFDIYGERQSYIVVSAVLRWSDGLWKKLSHFIRDCDMFCVLSQISCRVNDDLLSSLQRSNFNCFQGVFESL